MTLVIHCSLKRTTITMSEAVAQAVEAYRRDQELSPSLTSIAEAALTAFLAERGYLPSRRRLRITPAKQGSGHTNTSIEHDRALADE